MTRNLADIRHQLKLYSVLSCRSGSLLKDEEMQPYLRIGIKLGWYDAHYTLK